MVFNLATHAYNPFKVSVFRSVIEPKKRMATVMLADYAYDDMVAVTGFKEAELATFEAVLNKFEADQSALAE